MNESRGRPNTSTDDEHTATVSALIVEDALMSVRRIAETVGISKSSAHLILYDNLGLTLVCARWVPRLLTPQMKLHRVMACEENLGKFFMMAKNFLNKL